MLKKAASFVLDWSKPHVLLRVRSGLQPSCGLTRERRVLARLGRAGVNADLFEHSSVRVCRVKELTFLLIAGVFLFGVSGDGLAQTGSLDHSPTEVVKHYLALDAKGARLDAKSYDALVPYTNWSEEPVWGRVVVIESYTVPEDYRQWEIVNKLEVVIPVEFRVLGAVYLETAGYIPDIGSEQVRFRVKAVKNRWRIVEPIVPPHVGQKRMINFVRQATLQETDQSRRASLTSLQEELRKAKQ